MPQLIVIAIYLSLLIVLGFVANRLFTGTSKDYMLASHSIGPFLLLMSLFGTTMTAFALVGSTGRAYTLGAGVFGLLATAGGIVHSLCFFVIGVPLWKAGRKHGFKTQIQYFRERLDNQIVGYLMFPILVVFVITYLLVGVVAAGSVINELTAGAFEDQGWFESAGFGVPKYLASGVVCGVVLTYVYLGGMRGTAWANAIQTIIFMVLGVITFVTIANAIGKTDSFFENLKIASSAVPEANITRAKIPMSIYFSFLFIPLSVGMFPHVFQHWLTAKSASTFKTPIVMHPVFVMIVWAPCVMIGIWASSAISGLPEGIGENAVLAKLVQTHASPILGGLLGAGILAAIMSSLNWAKSASTFKTPIVMHPVFVMIVWAPCVMIGIWASSAISGLPEGIGENAVLAKLVQTHASPILGGLLGAGILAAIMSSLDSQFLCLGTMFTEDIVDHVSSQRLSDRAKVISARVFIFLIVVAVFFLSIILPRSVFDLGLWSFTGFTGLFPIIFAAIYWKRLTAYGATSAVLTTIGLWVVFFWLSDFGANKKYALMPFGSAYPLHPVVIVFLGSSLAMVLTSYLTPPPAKSVIEKFFK